MALVEKIPSLFVEQYNGDLRQHEGPLGDAISADDHITRRLVEDVLHQQVGTSLRLLYNCPEQSAIRLETPSSHVDDGVAVVESDFIVHIDKAIRGSNFPVEFLVDSTLAIGIMQQIEDGPSERIRCRLHAGDPQIKYRVFQLHFTEKDTCLQAR